MQHLTCDGIRDLSQHRAALMWGSSHAGSDQNNETPTALRETRYYKSPAHLTQEE